MPFLTEDQQKYGNDAERTVIGHEAIDPEIFSRELARYKFAAERIQPGMRVLEFGCSSGFGTRLLPVGIDYTGVDYSKEIIKYANAHFGPPVRKPSPKKAGKKRKSLPAPQSSAK